MGAVTIYFEKSGLEWTDEKSCRPDSCFDCATAFARLESGCDVHLVCGAREFLQFCRDRYKWVRAAGGVVTGPDGRLLLIRRNGVWDLPKGMVESDEPLSVAAQREVREETGVQACLSGRIPLLKTYHIYDKYGGWHLKQTSWYAMKSDSPTPLHPQREEQIELAEWVTPSEWRDRLHLSYASLHIVADCLFLNSENSKKNG